MMYGARVVFAVGLALAWTSVGLAQDDIDRTVDAAADGTITIENVAGEVVVKGWDRNEVQVTGELGRKVREVEIDADDGDVEIEVILPRHSHMSGRSYDANLLIYVPKGAQVEVETVSASVTMSGLTGEIQVETVSGAVDVTGEMSEAEIATVSGAITVSGTIGRVEAESVSGAIEIHESGPEVEASTTSGRIEIEGDHFDYVSCGSVSGRVRFRGTPATDSDLEFESFSGPVTLYLPKNLNADVEVETFSGSIQSDFQGRVRRERYGPGASLSETFGDGSADIAVSTFSGSIRLVEK